MTTTVRDGLRRVAALLVIGSCAATGLGCQATGRKKPAPAPVAQAPKPKVFPEARADPGLVRAGLEFEAKAKPDQEVGVHMEMGRGHAAHGQYEAAVADYQRALEVLDKPRPDRGSARQVAQQKATAHRKLAVALDMLGRFGQSDAHYQAALKFAPDDPKVWNNAGYSLYLQGRHADAERTLRTAVRLAPADPTAVTNLGLALTAEGKVDEAVRTMAKLIGPAAAEANAGFVLAVNGRRAEAVAHYRKALAHHPNLPEAESALARLAREGEPSAAPASATVENLPPLPVDASVRPASAEAPAKKGLFGRARR
jgi:Flp pilus assembly protein TadD